MNVSDVDKTSERFVRFRTRCIAYFAIWFLAGVGYWIFAGLDGPADTSLSAFKQIVLLPLEVPLMAVLGLTWSIASVFWVDPVNGFVPSALIAIGLLAFACLLAIAACSLRCRRLQWLVPMLCLHAATLTVSLFFYVRLVAEISS